MIAQTAELLAKAIDAPVKEHRPASSARADLIFKSGDRVFIVEMKSSARSATVSSAIAQLKSYAAKYPLATPVLVVPAMGDVGAALCKAAGVNWLDLSGNAAIDADGLRVRIRGRKAAAINEVGFNPFAHKASRAVHALLLEPNRPWTQVELGVATHLDKGFISKIVAELSRQGYIKDERAKGRRRRLVRVTHPTALLDAWTERYERPRAQAYGLLASRNGAETTRLVKETLERSGVDYAFTGLPAAAAYTGFASFRRVSLYVAKSLPRNVLDELHVEEDQRGRNVVISVDDAAARVGIRQIGNAPYASPILTYLDLASEPERGPEARDEMRRFIVERWQ